MNPSPRVALRSTRGYSKVTATRSKSCAMLPARGKDRNEGFLRHLDLADLLHRTPLRHGDMLADDRAG